MLLGSVLVGGNSLGLLPDSVNNGGWTTSAVVVSGTVQPGQTAMLKVTITSASSRHGLVNVQIHSPSTMVFQKSWNYQWFWKNKPLTFDIAWPVPAGAALGRYSIRVGLYQPGSNVLQHWNQSAGRFTVKLPGTTVPSTTTTAVTTTAVPTTTTRPTTTTAMPTTTTRPTTTTAVTTSTAITTTTAPTTGQTTTTTTVAPIVPGGSGQVLWSESFSSASGLDRLVKVISFGENISNGNEMQSFNGDHDHACGSPATTRALLEDYQISTHFWYCAPGGDAAKGHFMTGINTVGYVTMSFSPKADDGVSARVFPATATQACWDQNITDLGARKWTQLVVISAARYKANGGGINYINPDFNDNGGDADIHLAGDDFLFNNLRNTVHYFNGQSPTFDDYSSPLHGSTDKATRYTICVKDNGNGTVTRTQARPGGTVDSVTGPGRFPAGPRVFIIQDDSYNPMKAYESDTQYVTDPFTWHWDNIRIST